MMTKKNLFRFYVPRTSAINKQGASGCCGNYVGNPYASIKLVLILVQVFNLFVGCFLADSAMAGTKGSSGRTASLSADEILEKVKQAKVDHPAEGRQFTYLREANIYDLKTDGSVQKKTQKIYRAYTDGRDQYLLEINGKKASAHDRAKDRAHNLERQQKFLHRQSRQKSNKNNDDLMAKNMDLFRDKFLATLKGEEKRNDRLTYLIELKPKASHTLKNRFVDRLMNQIHAKVWVDKEEFRIARLEMKLKNQVSFLGGLAGLLRDIQIDVDQKQIKPNLWVDEEITAFFDVRVFFKTYRFKMESESSKFELVDIIQ
jgi:outer membrane lipoprotein-sorting protein